MTEKHLVENAKARDPQAISTLYDNNIKHVYRFVYYKTNHKEIAEDITSEVFVRAFEQIEKFRGKSSFKTWVCTIAKNLVIEWYRNKERTTQLIYEPGAKEVEETESNGESEKLLNSILSGIKNERYQKILELRYLMNYTLKEIAAELNVTVGNAKVIQNRAIKNAKKVALKLQNGT